VGCDSVFGTIPFFSVKEPFISGVHLDKLENFVAIDSRNLHPDQEVLTEHPELYFGHRLQL